jgi:hypothetical protein
MPADDTTWYPLQPVVRTSRNLRRRCEANDHEDNPRAALLLYAGDGVDAIEDALAKFTAWWGCTLNPKP